MKYKITKEHFEWYRKSCVFYQEKLNLKNWHIYNIQEKYEHKAWCVVNSAGRCATLGISSSWDDLKPTRESIDYAAFHEICELLLGEIRSISEMNESITAYEIHTVIRTLENCVLPYLPKWWGTK